MPGPIGSYLGQFSVNAMTLAVASTPNANVAAGDYYPAGYTGEGDSFAVAVQTGIRTVPGQGNANVSLSQSTGKFTLALNVAANINLLTDRLANIMGFSNGLAQPSSAVHVAASQARYLWRPSRAPSALPLGFKAPLAPRSSTISGRAPDGTTFTVVGALTYDAVVEYQQLPAADVITPEAGTIYVDLQQWVVDVVHAGKPFRWLVNRDQYTDTTDYVTCVWGEDGQEEVGSVQDYVGRQFESYNGLWGGKIPMMKKV